MNARQTIRNWNGLISQGDCATRKPVLETVKLTLDQLNVYDVLKRFLKRRNDHLFFGKNHWDLSKVRNIYVVGGGKAANALARAVEETIGNRITVGIVAVKKLEDGDELEKIELVPTGHPLPNKESLHVGRRQLELAKQATSSDLFVGLISGGSSALMSLPIAGISLEDEIACTQELLTSGARIEEINAVRRHISAINGGRLAQAVEEKGAKMINFIISDGVGNAPLTDSLKPARFFGTPVAPDQTSFSDACNVLGKYDLRSKIPHSIVEFIDRASPSQETPKAFSGRIQHFIVQKAANAGVVAMQAAKSINLNAVVLTTFLQGESHEAGTFLASIAQEIATYHRPFSPPCLLIAGGETTTTIDSQCGLGGPSQELALGFALEISGHKGICLAAIDTDGSDGPTQVAGGIVDGTTVERARQIGIDVYHRLQLHDSLKVFEALGDTIITGNTGTNVCDLNVMAVL